MSSTTISWVITIISIILVVVLLFAIYYYEIVYKAGQRANNSVKNRNSPFPVGSYPISDATRNQGANGQLTPQDIPGYTPNQGNS